jgi:nitrogen fixation/metabolism regulation signal transduction histidine kinase
MTQQVADARAQAETSLRQLESARTRLQTILDNLTPGVIVFDRLGRIDTVNPGVTRILRVPIQAWAGRALDEVPGLQDFGRAVAQRFETLQTAPEEGERGQWQDSFVLQDTQGLTTVGSDGFGGPNPQMAVTLLARGAWLPGQARLLVFDDITEVISAQRAQAWAEVARRLAHEIKNPLTPIQLSAERLQQKLEHRLEGADQALLIRSVATIVNQVQAMKTLVNEFRDYARLPSAQPVPLPLNDLVAEVLGLYGEAQDAQRLVSHLSADLPAILGDATQLRQVVHNLVQNALDAVAEHPQGRVEVTTEAVRAEDGTLRGVRLAVVDNGPGFAEHVLKRAFEPYVTTKARGTGLGLAVVKKIADEHQARIRLTNLNAGADGEGPVKGARVSLSFACA